MFVNTQGLVLREVNYKEADKILTVLTRDEGKITVNARGARRKSSRIAGASQLLTFSDMTLFSNKGRWSLNEAATVEQFAGLRADIEKLALGTYFAELMEILSDADSPQPEMLSLGLNSLYALSNDKYPPLHIKAVFELRMMCIAGFEPMLESCPVCGAEEPESPLLNLTHGTVCCSKCRKSGEGEFVELCEASLAALRYVMHAPAKQVFSFRTGGEAQGRLYRLAELYLLDKLERGLKTLDYFKKLGLG